MKLLMTCLKKQLPTIFLENDKVINIFFSFIEQMKINRLIYLPVREPINGNQIFIYKNSPLSYLLFIKHFEISETDNQFVFSNHFGLEFILILS